MIRLLQNKNIWFIPLIIGTLLRTIISFEAVIPSNSINMLFPPIVSTDTEIYFSQADAIRSGGWENFFPNGYPLLMSLLPSEIGSQKMVDQLLLINVVLSSSIIVLVYFITKQITENHLLAFIAALITALWPNQLHYVRQLLTEVPTAFFLLLAGYLFIVRKDFFSGIILGLAIIIRTSLLPMIAFLLLIPQLRKDRRYLLFFIGAVLPVLGIATFSWARESGFSIGGNTSYNFIIASEALSNNVVDFRENIEPVNEVQAVQIYLSSFFENPNFFVMQRGVALWELWGFWPSAITASGNTRSFVSRMLIGLRFPLLVFALIGFWQNRKDFSAIFLLTPIITITIVHTIFFSTPRFTYPIEPILIIFASLGFGNVIVWFRNKNKRSIYLSSDANNKL